MTVLFMTLTRLVPLLADPVSRCPTSEFTESAGQRGLLAQPPGTSSGSAVPALLWLWEHACMGVGRGTAGPTLGNGGGCESSQLQGQTLGLHLQKVFYVTNATEEVFLEISGAGPTCNAPFCRFYKYIQISKP